MKYKWTGLILLIFAACSAKSEPVHYTCYADDPAGSQPVYYMVVEHETGEFMFFDETGKYLNTAFWKNNHAMDNPRVHFVSNINGISLFFNLEQNSDSIKIWSFVMWKEGYDPAKSYCY